MSSKPSIHSKLSGFIASITNYDLAKFEEPSENIKRDINLYNQGHDFDILIRDKGKFGELPGDQLRIVAIVQRCL